MTMAERALLTGLLILSYPLHAHGQICISGGTVRGSAASAVESVHSFGIEHNDALQRTHDNISNQIPENMDEYVQIMQDQARIICDGDGECLNTLDNYTNHAISYVLQEQSDFNANDGGRRRLNDMLPKHKFSETLIDSVEEILNIIELDDETEIINSLENLNDRISIEDMDEKKFIDSERVLIEATISVAKASTSYWHRANRSDTNKFRDLASRNTIDCLFSGQTHFYDNNEVVEGVVEEEEEHEENYYYAWYNTQSSSDSSKSKSRHRNRKLRRITNTPSALEENSYERKLFRGHSSSESRKSRYTSHKPGLFGHKENRPHGHTTLHKHEPYDDDCFSRSSSHKPGLLCKKQKRPHVHATFHHNHKYDDDDDWYNKYSMDAYPPKDEEYFEDHPKNEMRTPKEIIGRFIYNTAYVIRADVIGVLVGATVGRGCVVPSLASSFLFSATYAVCYRRGL